MQTLLMVGIGGFFGAIARYWLSGWAQRTAPDFPLGTLVVNVTGCLLIGLLMTLIEQRDLLTPPIRLLLITGLLGSLTTFSTFGFETLTLLQEGRIPEALLSVTLNVCVGVGAVALGRQLVMWTI